MTIAVCVKYVPEGTKRIDPTTKRLDRSGEGALNHFDANAVEEALRLRDATGDGEVVLVSMGPAKAQDALRKALAMGADRALLVSDDSAAGSDLVATSLALARARRSAGARRLAQDRGRRQRRPGDRRLPLRKAPLAVKNAAHFSRVGFDR